MNQRARRGSLDMSETVSLVLIISGLMMIAGPLTLIYCNKMKQRRLQQGMINRLQQYSTDQNNAADQSNFVADNYMEQMKNENILNPKYLK